jgi:hypothetical protein
VRYSAGIAQGPMVLDAEVTMNFPDEMIQNITTPQGVITVEYSNGAGRMVIGPNEQPLPGAQVESLKNELDRHYLSVALRAGELEAVITGSEEVEGEQTSVIFLPALNMTMYVSETSGLPVQIRVKEFNPMAGMEIESITVYRNWQQSDGVYFAYEVENFVGGQSAAKTTISEHTVNP